MTRYHPELRAGEIFLGNTSINAVGVDWKTKRLGEVAYDMDGRIAKHLRPVFVTRDEIEKTGLDPDKL